VSIEKLIAGMDIPVEVVNATDVKSIEDDSKKST